MVIRVISIHHLWCLRCERIWAAFIQQRRPQNWLVKNGIPCSWSSWNMIIWHCMGWWRDFPWHWWCIVWIMNDHDNPRTNMYTLHIDVFINIHNIYNITNLYIYIHYQRKLRSQTSDNMDENQRWEESEKRREEKRREEKKKEKVSEERRSRCAKR